MSDRVDHVVEIRLVRLFGTFGGKRDTRILAICGGVTAKDRESAVLFRSFGDLKNGNVQTPSQDLWTQVLAAPWHDYAGGDIPRTGHEAPAPAQETSETVAPVAPEKSKGSRFVEDR